MIKTEPFDLKYYMIKRFSIIDYRDIKICYCTIWKFEIVLSWQGNHNIGQ